MSVVNMVIFGVVAAFLLAAVSPPARRFFKNVIRLSGAKMDAAADALRNTDPLGQYKSQIADAIENGRHAQKVVETAAQQLVSLNNQIAEDLKEQTRLTNRIRAVVAQGDPNKTAEQYALSLERTESNLATNQAQQAVAQATYNDNLNLVERYERDVSAARKDAEQMGFQLEQSLAEKNLVQMSLSLKNTMNLGDLAESRRRVQSQIDANKGASKAATDLSRAGIAEEADDDLERKERAAAILSRFQPKDV